jgi:hypothetical protein
MIRTAEEERRLKRMCQIIGSKIDDLPCKVLDAALFSAKTSMPDLTYRRVFIQDLTAALNRRKIIVDLREYHEFNELGYEYMED